MKALEPIEVQRARCEESRDVLRHLVRLHVEIDAPRRQLAANEPEWICRLRKVCLHAVAITSCDVSVDGMHVMTTELRVAYGQMDAVWECLPNDFRFKEDRSWWVDEAKGRLAEFNHPTIMTLALSLAWGGFADADAPQSYLRLAVWLGRLACGYARSLAYLARVLGTEGNIDARLESVFSRLHG